MSTTNEITRLEALAKMLDASDPARAAVLRAEARELRAKQEAAIRFVNGAAMRGLL